MLVGIVILTTAWHSWNLHLKIETEFDEDFTLFVTGEVFSLAGFGVITLSGGELGVSSVSWDCSGTGMSEKKGVLVVMFCKN